MLAQVEAVNALMEAELAKINAVIAANKDGQQAAVEAARRWAEQEHGLPVGADAFGGVAYSAKHWAKEAQSIRVPAPAPDMRGAVRVGNGLGLTEGDKLHVAVGPGIEITNGVVTAFGLLEAADKAHEEAKAVRGVAPLLGYPGEIKFFSIPAEHFPKHWYLTNGNRFPLSSELGQAINALPSWYKGAWRITVDQADTINLPSLFSGGRGFFLRAVDGLSRRLASGESDAFQGHHHNLLLGGLASGPSAIHWGGMQPEWGSLREQDASRYFVREAIYDGVSGYPRTATETRPLNIGMVPGVYIPPAGAQQ